MPQVFQKWSNMGVVAIFVVDKTPESTFSVFPSALAYLGKTLLASKRVCLIKPVCGSESLLLTYCLHHILLWSKHNFPIGGSLRLIRTHRGQQFSLPLLRYKSWQTTDTTELFSPKREQWKWASFVLGIPSVRNKSFLFRCFTLDPGDAVVNSVFRNDPLIYHK